MDDFHEAVLRALACARLDAEDVELALQSLRALQKAHPSLEPLGVTNAHTKCVQDANDSYFEDWAGGVTPEEARERYLRRLADCAPLLGHQ